MIWKFLKQNVLTPKGLNWVQHWVSRIGLSTALLILHSTILAFSSLRESSPIWACLARTSEQRAEGLRFTLARSRETRFARPNRRACSPARLFPALVENGVLVRKGLPAKVKNHCNWSETCEWNIWTIQRPRVKVTSKTTVWCYWSHNRKHQWWSLDTIISSKGPGTKY